MEEIVKAQSQDGNLEIVSKWSTEANCPSEGALFLASPDAKYFWINKDGVRMIGVLYLQKKSGEDLDLILPERLKEEAIRLNHIFSPRDIKEWIEPGNV